MSTIDELERVRHEGLEELCWKAAGEIRAAEKFIEAQCATINRLRTHIASAPTPEIVQINPGTYAIWYERELPKGNTDNE